MGNGMWCGVGSDAVEDAMVDNVWPRSTYWGDLINALN